MQGFRTAITVGLLLLCARPTWTFADRPPNLIVILTDDQGYADVGFNGCEDIPTPHIDRIANEGVRFTDGYVSYSVCGPSRAGLITGRYQGRFGYCRNPSINPNDPTAGVPLTESTLADLLRAAGYRTMAVGKWHLGTHETLRPRKRGFDEFYGFLSGGHNYFPHHLTVDDIADVRKRWEWYRTKLLHNGKRIDIDQYLTDALSDAAVDFVNRAHEKPFFLYLAYNAPHAPMQATENYLSRFAHIANKKRRTYAAMVSAVDDGVGRLLATLDGHELQEETLIFFLSDNGGPLSANGSRNDPLRGKKGTLFEGGIRVPFAARWSGMVKAGQVMHQPVSSLDIYATIAAHCGASQDVLRAHAKELDGINLIPHLVEAAKPLPSRTLCWRMFDKQELAIRSGELKFLKRPDHAGELFNLRDDVSETTALPDSDGHLSELQDQLDIWSTGLAKPAFAGLGSWPQPTRDPEQPRR